jgi:tetratricopeptide (TPR) repeat protein
MAGLAAAPQDAFAPQRLAHLDAAVELYADDFLAGFTLPDSPMFDEWQFFQRESLHQLYGQVLEQLVQAYRTRQAWAQAIPYARKWVALDQLHEPAHRTLMWLYAWAGQHAAALRQYQECVRILEAELGTAPEDETTTLYETIRTRQLGLPAAAARQSSETIGASAPVVLQAPTTHAETNALLQAQIATSLEPIARQGASPQYREERRWVTVLSADLPGFASLAERLDPEDLKALAGTGRYDEACHVFDQTFRFGHEFGIGPFLARSIAMSAGFHLDVFDFDGHTALVEEARDMARSVGFAPPLISASIDLLLNLARREELGRVEQLIAEVAGVIQKAVSWHGWLWRLRFSQAQAEIALARGAAEQAVVLAGEAFKRSRRTRPKYQVLALVTRAQALGNLGRTREAIGDLDQLCSWRVRRLTRRSFFGARRHCSNWTATTCWLPRHAR